eukprot:gnl/TRDRNA2_/TRDRNA2_134552_c2_seq1.p1 gnl/TRDRNA2_/TRDRNA2_134552_c2~~gnl/TRDRNA2_/TRDRNA2_134552_c2_seq1.p1  ORF type:complete len:565 (+),score=110.83 gnl/TRDRNA2_/TRDRNA2_134552_c2_seq1:58-1752(+)
MVPSVYNTMTTGVLAGLQQQTRYGSPGRSMLVAGSYTSAFQRQANAVRSASPGKYNGGRISPQRGPPLGVVGAKQPLGSQVVVPVTATRAAAAPATLPTQAPSAAAAAAAALAAAAAAPGAAASRVTVEQLGRVFDGVCDVERKLVELEGTGTMLRVRLPALRSGALMRLHDVDSQLLLQRTFGPWRGWVQRERSGRAIERCRQRCSNCDTGYTDRVQAMQAEIDALREELEAVKAEQRQVLAEEQGQVDAAAACVEQLDAMVEQMGGVSRRVTDIARQVRTSTPFVLRGDDASEATDGDGAKLTGGSVASLTQSAAPIDSHTKETLHALLAELDPRYLAPTQSPSLQEVVATQLKQQQSAQQSLSNSINGHKSRQGTLEQDGPRIFKDLDHDDTGVLGWNSGHIRQFVCQVLATTNRQLPNWTDWEWYTTYRTFDTEGRHRMNFEECMGFARMVIQHVEKPHLQPGARAPTAAAVRYGVMGRPFPTMPVSVPSHQLLEPATTPPRSPSLRSLPSTVHYGQQLSADTTKQLQSAVAAVTKSAAAAAVSAIADSRASGGGKLVPG